MTEMVEKLVEAVVFAWAKYLVGQGRDPKAELDAMLKTADASVDAAEREKFGRGT